MSTRRSAPVLASAPVFAALLVVAGPATAGPLLIAPTTVEFAPGRRGAAIEVTNQADEPVDLQFRAFAWDQQGQVERLAPTEALAISPPIATLPGHGKQVFRVLDIEGSGFPPGAATERSYRLLLNELPRAGGGSVRINVEFSLPVFITPKGAVARVASVATAEGITIVNGGDRRLRIADLVIRAPDGASLAVPGAASSYVLAGATRRYPLSPDTRMPAHARLVGSSDAGPIDEPLSALAAR